jgi:hypothetical protein
LVSLEEFSEPACFARSWQTGNIGQASRRSRRCMKNLRWKQLILSIQHGISVSRFSRARLAV